MSQTCVMPTCSRSLDEDDDLGVCGWCGVRIARRYSQRILAEERQRSEQQRAIRNAALDEQHRREIASRPPFPQTYEQPDNLSLVYYVRIGNHIKIGYTANLTGRLRALRVPPEDLLAVEPGGRTEERERHRQFNHLRISQRWENFTPGVELVDHIAATAQQHGIPQWLRTPRRGKNGPVQVRRAK